MSIPFLDLRAQHAEIRTEIEAAVSAVFEEQRFIGGPEVEACEREIAAHVGVDHGVGVSSGTDALIVALRALGVEPGDEIVTTPYTFFATGGSIHRVGARPVFVDIDPGSYNLDVAQLPDAVGDRTRGIVPVHLFGRLAEMGPVLELARARGLFVLEDACQAIGARAGGFVAGAAGAAGCFSFFPSKNLGGAGDGGMATTADGALADRMRRIRNHGSEGGYRHQEVGGNFRLDALQAAVVRVKLRHLDRWTDGRRANAGRYDRLFREAGLAPEPVVLPTRGPDGAEGEDRHVFNQYVIRVPRRDELRAHLDAEGIPSQVYYPLPLHLQPCFADLGYREGQLPESERASRETVALPVYPQLSDEQAERIVDAIRRFLG